ncbi:MAG: STN domain-containing protein, partial [Opitutaceae bacterium]
MFPRFLSIVIVAATAVVAAEFTKKIFDLPVDGAEKSLKRFGEQSGMEVLFPTSAVKGVRTRAVKGEMTARAALDAMLSGTPLVAVADDKTGSVTIK